MRYFAQGAALISTFALIIMQALANDWLPAQISVSQYAFGRPAPAYLIWMGGVAIAAACWAYLTEQMWIRVLLGLGAVAIVVAIVVRTDPGGAQESLAAKVHMVVAGLALVVLPLGSMALLRRRLRPVGLAIVAVSYLALILLFIAAFGVDVFGIGADPSWALAQAVSVCANQLLLLLVALTGHPAPRRTSDR